MFYWNLELIISKNTNDNEVYATNSSKKLPQSSDQISDMHLEITNAIHIFES